MLKQIKSTKKKVIRLLTEKPHLRDSDNKLIANIWNSEIGKDAEGKNKSISTTAFSFLEAFAAGKHTNPESIRRVRQKIQEQQPELRGESYKERQKEQIEITKNIHSV